MSEIGLLLGVVTGLAASGRFGDVVPCSSAIQRAAAIASAVSRYPRFDAKE